MSRLILPGSDLGKMSTMASLLNNSVAVPLPANPGKEPKDPKPGLLADEPIGYSLANMIPSELLERLQQEVPLFQERLESIQSHRQQARLAKENLRKGLDKLSSMVRDCWASLVRRNRRLEQPDSVRSFYLMPKARSMKVNGSRRKWLEIAQSVVTGDRRAVEEGYPPMAEPSAADLQQLITTVEAQLLAVDAASSLLKQVLGDMVQQRLVISDMHRDLAAFVRASLGGKPSAYRRDIMRALGFNFAASASTAPDPDTEPSPEENEAGSFGMADALAAATGMEVMLPA